MVLIRLGLFFLLTVLDPVFEGWESEHISGDFSDLLDRVAVPGVCLQKFLDG